jgi:hypothetical protein
MRLEARCDIHMGGAVRLGDIGRYGDFAGRVGGSREAANFGIGPIARSQHRRRDGGQKQSAHREACILRVVNDVIMRKIPETIGQGASPVS